jgi:GT2 family glycosyltransferase
MIGRQEGKAEMIGVNLSNLIGAIDDVSATYISGWIIDQEEPQRSLILGVLIDSEILYDVTADGYRPDVVKIGHSSPYVGFKFDIPVRYHDGEEHTIEFSYNGQTSIPLPGPGTNVVSTQWRFRHLLEDETQNVRSQAIVLHLDYVLEEKIAGWAYDEANLQNPPVLHLYIDDEFATEFRCDQSREDVKAIGFITPFVGFAVEIPRRFFDDAPHTLAFKSADGRSVLLPGSGEILDQKKSFRFPSTKSFGRVDGLHNGAIKGWALTDNRLTGKKTGGLSILVTMQGQPISQLKANQFRADVAESHGSDPNCGFSFVPPSALVAGKTIDFIFKIIPGSLELEQSPIAVSFYDSNTQRKLRDLEGIADQIFTQLWSLRSALRNLKPAEAYNLLTYDSWARSYYKRLSQRTPTLDVLAMDDETLPVVSVICPTYKPRIPDFLAAIKSVKDQTYKKWELLIVDDGSQSTELNKAIASVAKGDSRIKVVYLQKNEGISAATNVAIKAATGQYIALFDHDDMLVDKALEFMVSAAIQTGAKMLYSDEDKIDDAGIYSEVNFKPDWNHRLLLSQNYVCHLLMVKASHLATLGLLRSECDGAQDHDLILRLVEGTPEEDICHVKEVLYHWRKTPFSTATSGKAKPYTIAAGIRAVSDHLKKILTSKEIKKHRLKWQVTAPFGNTIYRIHWHIAKQPKVTIIIPYREQIAMTERCVRSVQKYNLYNNYEILLVDNWSTSDEAHEFSCRMQEEDGIMVLRVEEPFNYSRINNLAVASTSGDFLLFLNNDVMFSDPEWLTQMVGEALSNPKVGVVGSKLLYPNGLVQHGGVILGVGGIADHAYRGLTADDPGYMARAICAQELSAVTAACMLCRRSVFEEVGGFDETDLRVAFNDVDLCLKIGQRGYRVIWTPTSIAEHHESLSRGNDFQPDQQVRFFHENQVMLSRWKTLLEQDPHYSRFFSRNSGMFLDLVD